MVTAIAIEKNYNNHMSIEELQDQKQVKSKNSSRKRPRPSMIPQDFFAKVEFNKIREMLVDLCKGEQGKAYYRQLDFYTSAKAINQEFRKSSSYFESFSAEFGIPNREYYNISNDLFLLSKENYMLDIESIFRINASIRLGHELVLFFNEHDEYYDLKSLSDRVIFDPALVSLINKVLDEEGNVRPNASPELQKITKNIASKIRELDKEFDQVVKYYKERNMLKDSAESYRNGRRVLSVPAEHKRQVGGVIHDESATGKTVFLEPEAVIRLNTDLFKLESDQKTEINRIIRQLCTNLRGYIDYISSYHKLIVQLDIIGARAKWARKINGSFPLLDGRPNVNFKEAYHPLLKLKNEEQEKETVPFDLELKGKNRILLLSGPNAGGKSILMKSVVLLQTMVQCAIPVPVHEDSKPGFFKKFIADIGDQQSIENDLSTYSSRLKIMSEALEVADQNTLLVIDEFGSGTDPKFGGALAESMLKSFNQAGVFGVVTTHYSNLKIYAYRTKGIINGAMVFNEAELVPSYEMLVGKPGSSFAFEIADKSGIPAQVMKFARQRTGDKTTKVEDLLVDLQREKAETEQTLMTLEKKEKELERLISTYNQLYKELDIRRKKVKIKAREADLRDTAEKNRVFENLIRELKEEKKLEKAQELAAEMRQTREVLHEEMSDLETKMYQHTNFDLSQIKEGDFVKIGMGEQVGTVNWIRKKKVEVQFGHMKIEAKLADIKPAKEPIEIKRSKSVQSQLLNNEQTLTKLDLRGMSKQDASRMTEEFFDKGLLGNAHELVVVHGIGNGILRKEVYRIAKEYRDFKEIYHPPQEAGGEGVTIVKL